MTSRGGLTVPGLGVRARPIQMLLEWGLGYISGGVLNETGLPTMVYNRASSAASNGNPLAAAYKEWIDTAYQGSGVGGGGGTTWVKTAGTLLGLKTGFDMTKRGIKDSDINVKLPLFLGMMMDGPVQGHTQGAFVSGPNAPMRGGGSAGWA